MLQDEGIDSPKTKMIQGVENLDNLKKCGGKIGWFYENLQMKWLDTIKTIILKVMWYTKANIW